MQIFLIQIFLHRYPDLSKTRDEIKNALDKNPGSFENAYAELTGGDKSQVENKETTASLRSPNANPISSLSSTTKESSKKTKKSKSRKIGMKAATWSWIPVYTSKGSYW